MKHLQNFAPPFQLSENEKFLKAQVESLTNSKKANEKVKRQLKKEINKLYEENIELKENLENAYDVNTQLQNMVKKLENNQDDLMEQNSFDLMNDGAYAVTDGY